MAVIDDDDRLSGTLVADRYRVGRKLGEGGMGLVYLAVHEGLKKQVALKILGKMARIEREAIARFEREAIAAGNLKHPNIAEATDFGQLPDGGGLYLVMEYVEGTTLRRLLAEQGKLAPERALAILQQVGSALATAHASDVVHRDLKPENVIVSSVPDPVSSGSDGRGGGGGAARATRDLVKVIDFGVAKLRSATFGAGATGLTTAGTVFGTPSYMSPEQVMGQVVDSRADQYALGVLAFELFTGKPPYQADDVGQLMMMHVGAAIPSTCEQTPTLPPEVDVVIRRMLAKLPDQRFDSAAQAMQALATALSAPSSGAPAGPPTPSSTKTVGPGKLAPQLPKPAAAVSHEATPTSPTTTTSNAVASSPKPNVVESSPKPVVVESSPKTIVVVSSPTRSEVVPTTASHNTQSSIIVIGVVGVVSLLLGVLIVVLLARSCGAPKLSPELEAALVDWRSGNFEPAAAAIGKAVAADPKVAELEAVSKPLAASVADESAQRVLTKLFATTALGRSRGMAAALAEVAVADGQPKARDGALGLLRARQDLLSKEQGARVRLRDAATCEAFEIAKTQETEVATTTTQRDLERLGLGECTAMLRVSEVCETCTSEPGSEKGRPGPAKGKGKGNKKKR